MTLADEDRVLIGIPAGLWRETGVLEGDLVPGVLGLNFDPDFVTRVALSRARDS